MLLDVSQPVTVRTACFPGDQPFECGWTARLDEGASVNVGWVRTSPHVGTHVDAPYHFAHEGRRVGGFDLETFVGPALVVDARDRQTLDADILDGLDLAGAPRVLFRTQERTDPTVFTSEFPVLTPRAIEHLAAAGVRLVGVDVPSVDTADSKDLPNHHALGRAGIANVENLKLDGITPGTCELLAAPIAWNDLDAAPLRALLRRPG